MCVVLCIHDAVCVYVSLIHMSESIHKPQHTCKGQKTTAGVVPPLPSFLETIALFLPSAYSKLARSSGSHELPGIFPSPSTVSLQNMGMQTRGFAVCSGDLNSGYWAPATRALFTDHVLSSVRDFHHGHCPPQRYTKWVTLIETCGKPHICLHVMHYNNTVHGASRKLLFCENKWHVK